MEKSYVNSDKENINPNKMESKSALYSYGSRSKSPIVNRSAILNVNTQQGSPKEV